MIVEIVAKINAGHGFDSRIVHQILTERNNMTTFLIGVVTIILLFSIVEYIVHRWFMHGHKSPVTQLRLEHQFMHHDSERNDMNIDMKPWRQLKLTTPVWIPLTYFFPALGVFFVAIVCFHAYLWTKVHRAHHDLEDSWVTKTSLYKRLRRHHLKHQEDDTKNFGVIWIWNDYFFGTKI